jgi:hypothetical protein
MKDSIPKKEVKVINAIIDLLDDMAFSLSEMEDNLNDVIDQVDAIDEDLGSLEDDFYDEGEEEDSDEEDGCFYEVTCPNCNETVCLSEDLVQKGHGYLTSGASLKDSNDTDKKEE